MDAGFLVGLLLVAGLADGIKGKASLDCKAVVALGDEVDILPTGNGKLLTSSKNVVLRGELGNSGRGVELEARFGPGRDATGAPSRGFDGALPGVSLVLTGRSFQNRGCVPQAFDGW